MCRHLPFGTTLVEPSTAARYELVSTVSHQGNGRGDHGKSRGYGRFEVTLAYSHIVQLCLADQFVFMRWQDKDGG